MPTHALKDMHPVMPPHSLAANMRNEVEKLKLPKNKKVKYLL